MKIATPDEIDLVIYHGNCFDGFTAAWCAWLLRGERAEYLPALYGDPPHDVAGRNVVLVDFAYKRPVLEQMSETAKSIAVLDHHATAQEDLAGLEFATFDMEKSGARLAYEWFLVKSGCHLPYIETLVNYVQDRDLWRWELPDSRAITEAMKVLPFEFGPWDQFAQLLHRDMGAIVDRGVALLELTEQHLRLLEATAAPALLDGTPCYVANAPYIYASELGGRLSKHTGFGITWRYDHHRDITSFSMRSTPTSGIDVSAIGAIHGGGGHVHAAGFEIRGSDPWQVLTKA